MLPPDKSGLSIFFSCIPNLATALLLCSVLLKSYMWERGKNCSAIHTLTGNGQLSTMEERLQV
jgi:hypothetical protein